MCPNPIHKCGPTRNIRIAFAGQNPYSARIQNLTKGDICTYRILTKCGAPAFRIRKDSNVTSSKVQILYTEADNDITFNRTAKTSYLNTTIADRKKMKPPGENQAPRDLQFLNAGNSSRIQGQRKPPRRRKDGSGTE